MNPMRRGAGQVGRTLAGMLVLVSAAMAQEPPPLPPPRPDRPVLPQTGSSPRETPSNETATEAKDADDGERTACLDRLRQLGLTFERRPVLQEKSCRVDNPVLVSSLPNGVRVAPASLMGCPAAENISRWIGEIVAPEAERRFGSKPTTLLIGTAYECRDQRNGEKLSEHAFGNGLDVMGFEFDKRGSVGIGEHAQDTPEAEFQSTVRKGACAIFTTVLGPGSDAAHGDHLHLDLRQRKAGYRICQ